MSLASHQEMLRSLGKECNVGELVCIKTYLNRPVAEGARMALEARGIDAVIRQINNMLLIPIHLRLILTF